MTTSTVMTVTDELLAELEDYYSSVQDDAQVLLLTAELRRLRAENAGLAQSLAESRANDQAAMGWLTSLRWASGDRGERMLPELVEHIEGLAKDAGRYRWVKELIDYDSWSELSEHLPDEWDDYIDTAMATQ